MLGHYLMFQGNDLRARAQTLAQEFLSRECSNSPDLNPIKKSITYYGQLLSKTWKKRMPKNITELEANLLCLGLIISINYQLQMDFFFSKHWYFITVFLSHIIS